MAFAFNPITGKLDLVGSGGSATTDASLLTSGTLADARLSSNVSLDNINNDFSVGQSITAAANTSALTASYSVTGANTTPLLDLSGTWNTTGVVRGIRLNITDTASAFGSRLIDLQVGGSSVFNVSKFGAAVFSNGVSATGFTFTGANNVSFTGTGTGLSWQGGNGSLLLEAANTLALRNGGTAGTPVPQNFRVYNWGDTTNFERGFMRWNANVLEIGTEAGGTGSGRALTITSSNLTVQTSGLFSASFNYYNGAVLVGPVQVRNPSNLNAWLNADANNVLGIRNGTAAQTCNIYSTFTSASVFERLRIAATSDRNQVISESTGGTVRPLEMSFFSSANDPTTANITSGAFGVWKNTTSGTVRLWVNDGGTMRSVQLT